MGTQPGSLRMNTRVPVRAQVHRLPEVAPGQAPLDQCFPIFLAVPDLSISKIPIVPPPPSP